MPFEPTRVKAEVINAIKYDPERATLLASDWYWDGHNYTRRGRNTFLFRGKNGHYFTVVMTMWQGEMTRIYPQSLDAAIEIWDTLATKEVEFEEAFPNVEVLEA